MSFILSRWEHRLTPQEKHTLLTHGTIRHKQLGDFISIWPILRGLVKSEDDLLCVIRAAIGSLANSGLSHIELRSTVFAYAAALNIGMLDAIRITGSMIKKEGKLLGIKSGLILSFDRGHTSIVGTAHETAPLLGDLYRDGSIIGVDITGNEEVPENESISVITRSAKLFGIPITFHAGETGNLENIQHAVQFHGAKRIGHATAISKCKKTIEMLALNQVCVEVCVTSNVATGILPLASRYPLEDLAAGGVPFVICTDNPALLGITLETERNLIASYWGDAFVDMSDKSAEGHSFL